MKDTILLADNSEYFVLEDPTDMRHLVPSCYYKKYDFTMGQTLRCRVDKINCTGKIFLEPQHPFYREGKIYYFLFIETAQRIHKKTGKPENYAIVKDTLGFEGEFSVENPATFQSFQGKKIRCKLLRIKKGKLLLQYLPD
ncbi:MAG: hypothetical protein M0R21_08725 [Lentimicrobiaceae bacterium]|nr:hypothetical protein [Lentimicrobiaceae bacterium]